MAEDFGPEPFGLEDEFDSFADGAGATGLLGHVVCFLLYFGAGVGSGDGEADAVHDDDIGEVVADVGDFFFGHFGIGHDFFEDRDFFSVALVYVGHFALAGALGGGGGFTAADDAGFDAVLAEPLESYAVLGIEAFGFDDFAGGIGEVVEVAIREDTIDVHEQHLNRRGKSGQVGGQFTIVQWNECLRLR